MNWQVFTAPLTPSFSGAVDLVAGFLILEKYQIYDGWSNKIWQVFGAPLSHSFSGAVAQFVAGTSLPPLQLLQAWLGSVLEHQNFTGS